METYYVYMVKCSDNTLYTGYTNDLFGRLRKHNSGKGAKYTSSRRPVELVYQETCETKSEALKREHVIKQLTRKQKLFLLEGYHEQKNEKKTGEKK